MASRAAIGKPVKRQWQALFQRDATTLLLNNAANCKSVRHASTSSAFVDGDRPPGFEAPPAVPNRRVVVTGLGLVTPLAVGVDATWQRLIGKQCGIRSITPEVLQLNGAPPDLGAALLPQLPSQVAAYVPRGSGHAELDVQKWMPSQERHLAPFVSYALCAAEEALVDAGWKPKDPESLQRTGVAIGGGIGCIGDIASASNLVFEKKLRRLTPFFVPRILINMAAGNVSIAHGFMGPNHSVVTACASGAHSVGDAARFIRCGDADVMLAGGSESSLDPLSIAGFCRLKALSTKYNDDPIEASRPFDNGRDGFVIGEGSGILVLEELEHARARGAKMYAEVRGYGTSGDAHHITQPQLDGMGAVLAMTRALKQAGVPPEDVGYVNAHATSTLLGDAAEARAIVRAFGAHAAQGRLALSSTKGATGHLLGAAGAVEAVFTVLALHKGVAPPTLNLESPDATFDDKYAPLAEAKEVPMRAALTNSFGFGGTNASLLFTQPP